ncbi:inositol monophosphatase family protein [Marinoscillum furvescens]|uniref:Fructose-1,6-bisphosphatase/inositol monophosphatase family enzyme n=1 Tax=Marinoscillum furvescens DSM 4134 TaxID=1122208 RepID=A0A3D9L2H1_MARFU|nr:inositol monophosphatase family protein [Marinoscillum furvescens]RED97897.1 fructose-1,6-bisphosphatase/inositol monophosphatase family enzyme [Marinoscillum furvescens DSM 4134]
MTLTEPELQHLCQVAISAAEKAGNYIQSQFDQHYEKQRKTGGDSLASQVVTAVDIEAQDITLDHLNPTRDTYDLGLLTEELADDHSRLTKEYFWCIDPMDGTLPFTERRTGYAVSIALISKAGDPVVGVVMVPDLGLCYHAIKGSGVFCNGDELDKPQSDDKTLHFFMDQSFLAEPYFKDVQEKVSASAQKLGLQGVKYIHDFGGVRNALGVLQSKHGCYVKYPKKRKGCGSIWDYAATRLMGEELGCVVSNAQGERLHLNNENTTFMNTTGILYATDPALARELLQIGRIVVG